MATKTQKNEVTQEQIDAWKKEHDVVVQLEVHRGEHTYKGYIKNVEGRKLFQEVMKHTVKGELDKAGDLILKNCWLGGDEELKTDYKLKSAASLQAFEALDLPEASATRL